MAYTAVYEELIRKLRSTGIIGNDHTGRLNALLAAFSEGIGNISDQLDSIYREMFVITALDKGLSEYEKMLSSVDLDNSIQGKRNSIITSLSFNNKNGGEMVRDHISDIYNLQAVVSEGSGSVIVDTAQAISEEQSELIRKHMSLLMPVTTVLDFRT